MPFHQLTALQLYRILQLRNQVFVLEQNCVYQDCDNKDFLAHHLFAFQNDLLLAYSRLLPPGAAYVDEASIGRVVTSPFFRKKDLGKELMRRSVDEAYHLFGTVNIIISAQLYLQKFYEGFGFISEGKMYEEDGIPHIQMRKNPSLYSQ